MQAIDQIFHENSENFAVQVYLRKTTWFFLLFFFCDILFENFIDIKFINGSPYSPSIIHQNLFYCISIGIGVYFTIAPYRKLILWVIPFYLLHKSMVIYALLTGMLIGNDYFLELMSVFTRAFVYTWFLYNVFKYSSSYFWLAKLTLFLYALHDLIKKTSVYLFHYYSPEYIGVLLPILLLASILVMMFILKPHISQTSVSKPIFSFKEFNIRYCLHLVVIHFLYLWIFTLLLENPYLYSYLNRSPWSKTVQLSSMLIPILLTLIFLVSNFKSEHFFTLSGFCISLFSGLAIIVAITNYPGYTNIPYLPLTALYLSGHSLIYYGLLIILIRRPPSPYVAINAVILLLAYPLVKLVMKGIKEEWLYNHFHWFCPTIVGIALTSILWLFISSPLSNSNRR